MGMSSSDEAIKRGDVTGTAPLDTFTSVPLIFGTQSRSHTRVPKNITWYHQKKNGIRPVRDPYHCHDHHRLDWVPSGLFTRKNH